MANILIIIEILEKSKWLQNGCKEDIKKKKEKLSMHGNPEHYFKSKLYTG